MRSSDSSYPVDGFGWFLVHLKRESRSKVTRFTSEAAGAKVCVLSPNSGSAPTMLILTDVTISNVLDAELRVQTPSEDPTFDVLSEAHGRGHRLALAVVALLLEDVVVARHVVQTQLFPPLLLLLVSGRQLLGEGEHGEDDEQHGHGAQQEAAPPRRRQEGQSDQSAIERQN